MKVKIYNENEKVLKPINIEMRMLKTRELNNPSLVCVDEHGNYVCTLLYFHTGKGGLIPVDGTKNTLLSYGYDISGLHFDNQGAIRFKEPDEV